MTTPDNRALWELVENWRARYAKELKKTTRRPFDAVEYKICANELAEILERPVVVGGWLPIESAPRGIECHFWVVAKTTEEMFTDSDGVPIKSFTTPHMHRGKYGTWSAASKATHWMPLPVPPETNESMVRGKS